MTKDEALKLALEALTYIYTETTADEDELIDQAITAIKEALAQPEQEPLAWISTGPASMIHWTSDKPAYGDDWVPLYTTPPQRKPQYDKTKMNCFVQDLYDKKIQEGKHGQYEAMFHVVHRAIEAAHGIKE